MSIELIYGYILHLLSALALVGFFVLVYLRITPFAEIALIRKGCLAPALSFGGTLIGFSWTVASGILHVQGYLPFLIWAGVAMAVQLASFLVLQKALPNMKEAIESNNVAMGALMGAISLAIGLINGACLS